jgi:Fe-S cluster assembly protein SufD
MLLAASFVQLDRDATYKSFALTTGAALSRHQISATLTAPGGEVHLDGVHVLGGEAHADTTTFIDHAAPHCASRETYRQVLDGHARGVFQGKILVRPQAQKTDGFQLNQALMLSDTAEINAKPELEIYADDVKCSHGATSGRLDDEALFYLRSRGIPEAEARQMLVQAFIGATLDLIEHEEIRAAFGALT